MYKRIFFVTAICSSAFMTAQVVEKDTIQLEEINVLADLPITTETISKDEIEDKNLAQDMPILLKNATSVVTTSDAGAGVGYTSMRIRGIGNNQVNVTFNGVPVNDSDSHGVFWVDFPDISSSSQGVTIQRGVGTSSNGAQAFGASVNLETNARKRKSFAELMATYGSYNTQKYMLSAGSGDFAKNKFNVDARVSYVNSDGFLDRAHSKLFSTAINARYMPNPDTEIHIMNIFGHENTYQAWNGVDKNSVKMYGRTFNSTGAIYNDDWSIKGYYDNQVDNYDQNHLHAYWKQKWNRNWSTKTTLHYTRGIGYYEEYKQNRKLNSYLLSNTNKNKADLVRRQYLDNHFYGGIFNAEGNLDHALKLYFGASINQYQGDHYGKVENVIDASYTKAKDRYYENRSIKTEVSAFAKALKQIGFLELFADIQLRTIQYEAKYINNGKNDVKDFAPFDNNYTFINPKVGLNYNLSSGKLYATYGLTHREPTRKDIINSGNTVKEETLHDFELGYRVSSFVNLGINLYYMYYFDQLVLTGEIDDVGALLRDNVGQSYRAGIEFDVSKRVLNDKINLFGNLTYSENKNINYKITNSNGVAEDLGDTDIAYSPDLISSFGLDFYPTKGLKFNLTNKYVSKQFVTNTESKEHKLGDYFLSDFLARYKFNISPKNRAEISLLVNNIFDREYANNGYDYDGTLYYFPQAGTNFLAGFKLSF